MYWLCCCFLIKVLHATGNLEMVLFTLRLRFDALPVFFFTIELASNELSRHLIKKFACLFYHFLKRYAHIISPELLSSLLGKTSLQFYHCCLSFMVSSLHMPLSISFLTENNACIYVGEIIEFIFKRAWLTNLRINPIVLSKLSI